MFFFNLSFGEFLTLLTGASATVVLLYLLDRSKQRLTVSTLRFWSPAIQPAEQRQRKRIQQPWSMLLQLISLALLLAAIAQLRWGSPDDSVRDHVLIMDTSAWMAARVGNASLMDQTRANAKAWLRSLPAPDRVMLVRADSAAVPVTAFESKRELIERAIDESRPGAAALRLEAALRFAESTQRQHARSKGEIVFAGAGRIASADQFTWTGPRANWRFLPVKGRVDDLGIRRIGVRRAPDDPSKWQVLVTVRNYGSTPRAVPLEVRYGGAAWATRRFSLAAGAEQETSFDYQARSGGLLEARIIGRDAISEDDRAIIELPGEARLTVIVYSNEPELLRPVLAANPRIDARYKKPSEYTEPASNEVVILDRMPVPATLKARSIAIAPPGEGRTVAGARLRRWRDDSPIGSGLRTRDITLDSTQVYAASLDSMPVAEVDGGPVIVAQLRPARRVTFGFHPLRTALRYELASPLLFASVLKWLAPESFERWELNAASAGMVMTSVDEHAPVEVRTDRNEVLPYTRQGKSLRFFMGAPGTVRVRDGEREIVYSLTLPEIGETEWTWPAGIRRGVPAAAPFAASWRELWPWLAFGGALGLLIEWLLFGLGQRGLTGKLSTLFGRKPPPETAPLRMRRAS